MFLSSNKARDNEFFGTYESVIVSTDDPEKKGRVKVEVFGILENVSLEKLPWAIVIYPVGRRFNEGAGIRSKKGLCLCGVQEWGFTVSKNRRKLRLRS